MNASMLDDSKNAQMRGRRRTTLKQQANNNLLQNSESSRRRKDVEPHAGNKPSDEEDIGFQGDPSNCAIMLECDGGIQQLESGVKQDEHKQDPT